MLNHQDPRRAAQLDLQSTSPDQRFFNHLSLTSALEMSLVGVIKLFPKDSVLLREREEVEEVYIIQEGFVASGLYQSVNPSLWLYVSGPGALVDSFGLLHPATSPVTVVALGDVKALAIPQSRFAEIMGKEPAVEVALLRSLSTRLSLINQVAFGELVCGRPAYSRN
ncbi:MAG: Crp/Fnr family transcriptional regulator [Chloroflexi bacterium]|nr:Crp/Fnr family transcriptional regulator [Chloroflexota bacterium]